MPLCRQAAAGGDPSPRSARSCREESLPCVASFPLLQPLFPILWNGQPCLGLMLQEGLGAGEEQRGPGQGAVGASLQQDPLLCLLRSSGPPQDAAWIPNPSPLTVPQQAAVKLCSEPHGRM